jgi:hypothetical protein
MSRELSVGEKIEVLECVIDYYEDNKKHNNNNAMGLCRIFTINLNKYNIYCYTFDIVEYFPDFTCENSVKNANAKGQINHFWWDIYPFDFDNRIKFVQWMIERIQTGKEGTDE